jgi:hypothetical protein
LVFADHWLVKFGDWLRSADRVIWIVEEAYTLSLFEQILVAATCWYARVLRNCSSRRTSFGESLGTCGVVKARSWGVFVFLAGSFYTNGERLWAISEFWKGSLPDRFMIIFLRYKAGRTGWNDSGCWSNFSNTILGIVSSRSNWVWNRIVSSHPNSEWLCSVREARKVAVRFSIVLIFVQCKSRRTLRNDRGRYSLFSDAVLRVVGTWPNRNWNLIS